VAISVVVLPIFVAGLIATGKARDMIIVGCGLAGAFGCAAGIALIARTWLERRNPGEVLTDLSPYPLAGAIRRSSSSWLLLIIALIFPSIIARAIAHWLFPAVWVAFALLGLLTHLMYSDRVWLANRGLYFGGKLYPWDGFDRVAWTDDGRAFALRRRGRWRLKRWIVVPVPEGTREAAEEALRQAKLAKRPAVPRRGHVVRGLAALLAIGGSCWGLFCLLFMLTAGDAVHLLVFGPGYLVTIGYFVLCLRVPSPGWQRAIWGTSALVQGAWMVFFFGAVFSRHGLLGILWFGGVFPTPIFGAWWTFSFAASIYALLSLSLVDQMKFDNRDPRQGWGSDRNGENNNDL
jgi:hypothetical protein